MTGLRKKIPGFNLYEANNLGEIRSLNRITRNGKGFIEKKGRILKQTKGKDGYFRISLCEDGKQNKVLVHKIIAITFLEKVFSKHEINHKDGDKSNNNINNLEWCNHSENMTHAHNILNINKGRPWQGKFGLFHNRSKKINQCTIDGIILKVRNSIADIQRELGYKKQNISLACYGKVKLSYGYKRYFTLSPIEKC